MKTRTIHKFPLIVTDSQELLLPRGFQPLCVQVQHGIPCLWALVDAGAEKAYFTFRTYGTGHPITEPENSLRYVGTYQLDDGRLVFHVFWVVVFDDWPDEINEIVL